MRLILISLLAIMNSPAQYVSNPRIDYATYLGAIRVTPSIAVDSDGYAYVVGATGGGCDIAKINPSGTHVTCISVPSAPFPNALAMDRSGAIFVAGSATVVKLSPDGSKILYSTTITGASAKAIAVDSAGNAYIAGTADATFVTTPGAYQAHLPAGTTSASFAAKLNESGAISYATYDPYGTPNSIAVDSQGQLWMVGTSSFTNAEAEPAYTASFGYITRLDATGEKLLVSAGIQTGGTGGGGGEGFIFNSTGYGVAVDGQDAAYMVGSAGFGVPTTPGVLQPDPPAQPSLVNPQNTGYIVKLSASGYIVYGTYLGGLGQAATAVTVDESGNAVVALAGAVAPQHTQCGYDFENYDLFQASAIEVLNQDASALLTTAYLQSEIGNLAFGPRLPLPARRATPGLRSLYAVGTTGIADFFVTPGAYETLYPTGGTAATTAKIDLTAASGFQVSCAVNAASPVSNPSGAVVPGEIITLYGQQFPPDAKVSFDGLPAPILYADSNQINAVVPFEVASPTTNLSLETGREKIGPITIPVSQALPAIFPNGIVNQDGTVNSTVHKAAPGSMITVFMTGLGQMTPPIADGALGPLTAPFPVPVLGVSASVGPTYVPTPDAMAPVLFAGQAPGMIAGTVQVNNRVPTTATAGATTLWIYVGYYSAYQPITIE